MIAFDGCRWFDEKENDWKEVIFSCRDLEPYWYIEDPGFVIEKRIPKATFSDHIVNQTYLFCKDIVSKGGIIKSLFPNSYYLPGMTKDVTTIDIVFELEDISYKVEVSDPNNNTLDNLKKTVC